MPRVLHMVAGGILATMMATGETAVAAPASVVLHVSYRCDDGRVVAADYPKDPTERGATLTIDGHRISFKTALSADGGRYIADGTANSRTHLQWWIKGDDATLSEGPFDNGDIIVNASRTTTCHVALK